MIYKVYWIRILSILYERDKLEKQFEENPKMFEDLDDKTRFSYSYSDLEHHGIHIIEFTKELSKIVKNQNLKSMNFKSLLDEMMDPDVPYVNSNTEKSNARYFITALGKSAYKKSKTDDIVQGYWKIVDRTQQSGQSTRPEKKKRKR